MKDKIKKSDLELATPVLTVNTNIVESLEVCDVIPQVYLLV